MILYVVGDNHTAAAMAVNNFSTAGEDRAHEILTNAPHPDNMQASWATKVASALKMQLVLESASNTNTNIIKATEKWISDVSERLSPDDVLIIIAWNNETSNVLIRNYHLYLNEIGIKHIFFYTYNNQNLSFDFKDALIDETYIDYITELGCKHVIMSNEFYGTDAHTSWAKHILSHIVKNKIV